MKMLLTSVFGPFGVDDAFGRKENIMELFHNQVTREQGIYSLRMNHESFGLHLIADNTSIPTAVLDFPSQDRFIEELKKGYDYIGISFIVPNFIKAKRMATLIREHSPKTKIVLGGHGTSIEDIDKQISCDHVCRGDGVKFFRKLFGNDVNAKIKHPMIYSSLNKHVVGAPSARDAGVLLPGIGCANTCRFCCTTHFFDKKYTPFLPTGKDVFDVCVEMEEKMGVTDFFVMDENFLKSEERARELMALMEEHGKAYSFGVFSSAEAVTNVGVDFLERLGIGFVWMGLESKKEVYEKNVGIDFKDLIKSLRNRGIAVLASGILFLEHHTKETIDEDIDFMVGMNADLVQFMQLGPLPGTKLYNDYEKQNKLLHDIKYEEWHGQKQIWFKHTDFTGPESEQYLKGAFRKDFEINGPSILRICDTAIRGVLALKDTTDPYLKKRYKQRAKRANEVYPLLDALCSNPINSAMKTLALDVRKRYDEHFGKRDMILSLKAVAVQGLIVKEKIRAKLVQNNMRQPETHCTPYRMTLSNLTNANFVGKKVDSVKANILSTKMGIANLPVSVDLGGILDGVNIKALQESLINFFTKEDRSIVLNLSELKEIDEEALRSFLNTVKSYQHRFQLIYSQNIESIKIVVENLMKEFKTIKFVEV